MLAARRRMDEEVTSDASCSSFVEMPRAPSEKMRNARAVVKDDDGGAARRGDKSNNAFSSHTSLDDRMRVLRTRSAAGLTSPIVHAHNVGGDDGASLLRAAVAAFGPLERRNVVNHCASVTMRRIDCVGPWHVLRAAADGVLSSAAVHLRALGEASAAACLAQPRAFTEPLALVYTLDCRLGDHVRAREVSHNNAKRVI